ncbi:hypothetical protein GWK47_009481 [Chionoecetes opilio]|uniref:Uncharacterized protein n=1 Tax=Chionoecetes opilio TaxID=41210 RepID=A0A8J4XWX9_CHIOP|nr:hypothetical protein GWK47_009481 [Chionoecetes opilio]
MSPLPSTLPSPRPQAAAAQRTNTSGEIPAHEHTNTPHTSAAHREYMGGGIKVPDWRIYKVETSPELVQVQRALASHGLRDPWLSLLVGLYVVLKGSSNPAACVSLCPGVPGVTQGKPQVQVSSRAS